MARYFLDRNTSSRHIPRIKRLDITGYHRESTMKVIHARTTNNLSFLPCCWYDSEQGLVTLEDKQDVIFATRYLPQEANIKFSGSPEKNGYPPRIKR